MSASGSTKVIIISLFANLGIALSKLAGALFTKSASLLAESVHSFSDCGNQILLLFGQYVAKKPPTDKHPLGRSKEAFFWSFVVALLLFSIGGMFSIYEGIHKLSEPGGISYPFVGIAILVVAIILEGISYRACLIEVNKTRGTTPLFTWIRTTTKADLLVIFLEDLAALLGLFIAFFALLFTWITDNTIYDAVGSISIGVLLIVVACVLAVEVKSLLIGEASGQNYHHEIATRLEQYIPGASLIRYIALQIGVDAVMLAYKINPGSQTQPIGEVINAINRLEADMKARYPEISWQFVECDYEA